MWKELDDSILSEAFNGAELAAVARVRSEEKRDSVPGILAGVAAQIRGRIRSGGRSPLRGGESSVPAALWTVATDIIRYQVLLRYALNITEPRKLAWQQALKTLEDISSGAFVLPDEEAAVPGKNPRPAFFGRPARWGYPKGGGLM